MLDAEKTIYLAAEIICQFEDFKINSYQDQDQLSNEWFIGYKQKYIDGKNVKEGDVISKDKAFYALKRHLVKYLDFVNQWFDMHFLEINENKAASLLSFINNVGFGVFLESKLSKDIIIHCIDDLKADFEAHSQILKSGSIVKCEKLLSRRRKEYSLYIENIKTNNIDMDSNIIFL